MTERLSESSATSPPPEGDLTTTRAPFIEQAQRRGELFITQPYEQYSARNQETWRRLYAALEPRWREYATDRFLEGLENISLDPQAIPRLEDVNRFLSPRTGFQARPVSGYVPAYLFFDCLRRREFPTTITIRGGRSLEYLPEPDIFHDLAGHVPMHTDPVFADVLVKFGEVARIAAQRAAAIDAREERVRVLESNIKALARFFWFTIEFGLMRGGRRRRAGLPRLSVYGSGLLSSYEEIRHSVESPLVQRYDFHLEWVVNQYFEIDHFQPLLFVVESFEHLYSEVDRLERWILAGRLDNVSRGEPAVDEADLESFLEAGESRGPSVRQGDSE